jgi:4-amino-4-deoxy-L-arabinose transferase-like glycosyltransferase
MTQTAPNPSPSRWSPRSLALIVFAWAVLQLGGLFSPGLLDDVDSIYLQVAREMLQRHDYVTPTIDGIRFFDKPPLMYWMAAASMKLFGVHDWAARLPLALGVLALLLAVYALGLHIFNPAAPPPYPLSLIPYTCPSDRAALYAALALATSLGTYLYTRFYIPDILIALWMTLSVHLFLIALDRANKITVILSGARSAQSKDPEAIQTTSTFRPFLTTNSPLLPMLGFAAVMALNLLTKGLIGIIFPLAFVLLYLALTRQLKLLARLHLIPATLVFLVIAAPWHILAWLRNPAIAMPPGLGLPARAGWAWFYLYNEHIARFLGRRIPHDYGNVPVPLFWLLLLLWMLPWVAFLPAAILNALRTLRTPATKMNSVILSEASQSYREAESKDPDAADTSTAPRAFLPTNLSHEYQAALSLLLWPAIILGFFTLSSRQEYYHLPALPALALLIGGLLARADKTPGAPGLDSETWVYYCQSLRSSLYFLVPLGTLLFLLCGYLALTAPTPHPGVSLTDVLNSNPANYNLSLGHLFDLTGQAMGFFRGPLLAVALGMLTLGPIAYLVRRRGHTFAANLVIAAGMAIVLLAAHEGLARFYPILGSKDLALAIDAKLQPGDLIVIDGELTSGSTLLFYTPQRDQPVLLVNGRVNGPWFGSFWPGSFWPGSPNLFPDDAGLGRLWAGPHRIFLLTYHPESRVPELSRLAPVHELAASGGKTILSNQ